MRVILQWGVTRHKELPDVKTMVELGRTEEDRKVLALYGSGTDLGRSIAAPPGTPADRVEVLRRAFDAALQDPELLADVARTHLDHDPMKGEDLQKFIAEVGDVPAGVIAKVRAAAGTP